MGFCRSNDSTNSVKALKEVVVPGEVMSTIALFMFFMLSIYSHSSKRLLDRVD